MKAVIPKPEGFFNQAANKVLVKDYKNKNEKTLLFQNTRNILSII
jgi:hypothetical protein